MATSRQKITLEQVARAAGVSLATASRVLNKTGHASIETERRVRIAASRLDGGAEAFERTHTLCFLLANRPMLHPFHAHVLMGAHALAAERQSHILFYAFQYSSGVAPEDIPLPLLSKSRRLVDGYILGGVNSPNLLQLLKDTGVPLSLIGNDVKGSWNPEGFDTVWMDDVNGAFELTRYLQSLGHRRICLLASPHLPGDRYTRGYERAMKQAGLIACTVESDAANEQEAGFLAAKTLLSRRNGVTAILAQSDSLAHGAYDAIAALGLHVPQDISIAGCGDRPEAAALNPGLTTLWGYPDQVGRRLAELVLARIENPAASPAKVLLPTKVVKRGSCGRAPAVLSPHAGPRSRKGPLSRTPQ